MVKLLTPIFGLVILGVFINSCFLTRKNTTLNQEDFYGDQLKTHGYYYQVGKDSLIYPFCFLYKNGTLLYIGGRYNYSSIDAELLLRFEGREFIYFMKTSRLSWGVFQIDGDEIRFEKWYPSSGGPSPLIIQAGKIVNDTTFIITERYKDRFGKKMGLESKNETFYFKAFSPKPDSTTNFVK